MGSEENKGRHSLFFFHPLPFSFLAKKSTIYCNSLPNLVRVQEDREPEDLHLSGFVANAVSKIFSAGEHALPSVLCRVSFHVIRKPGPSQSWDNSAVGAPRWCADPCCTSILFVSLVRTPVASAQFISPGQVSCRILAIDGGSHGWSYFKQCFNSTVFSSPPLLPLLCLLHIILSTKWSTFHPVTSVGTPL